MNVSYLLRDGLVVGVVVEQKRGKKKDLHWFSSSRDTHLLLVLERREKEVVSSLKWCATYFLLYRFTKPNSFQKEGGFKREVALGCCGCFDGSVCVCVFVLVKYTQEWCCFVHKNWSQAKEFYFPTAEIGNFSRRQLKGKLIRCVFHFLIVLVWLNFFPCMSFCLSLSLSLSLSPLCCCFCEVALFSETVLVFVKLKTMF